MKQIIGLELGIPDVFKENEDLFMNQLVKNLVDVYSGKVVRFITPNKTHIHLRYSEIFTGNWDFVKMPEGW